MGRRLGIKRLNALSKNGAKVTGSLGNGASGSVGHRMIRKIGQEIITEIYVDLASSQGAFSQPGTTGLILGHSSSNSAGVSTSQNAELTHITEKENGVVTLVEMTCVEAPTGGDPDIDLVYATAAKTFSGSAGTALIAAGGALVLGSENATLFDANELRENNIYLSYGGATDRAAAATYTAGKLIIRLYGHAVPEDV